MTAKNCCEKPTPATRFRNTPEGSMKPMHQQLMLCTHCGGAFTPRLDSKGRGRPARYCGGKCRTYASRARKRAQRQRA